MFKFCDLFWIDIYNDTHRLSHHFCRQDVHLGKRLAFHHIATNVINSSPQLGTPLTLYHKMRRQHRPQPNVNVFKQKILNKKIAMIWKNVKKIPFVGDHSFQINQTPCIDPHECVRLIRFAPSRLVFPISLAIYCWWSLDSYWYSVLVLSLSIIQCK